MAKKQIKAKSCGHTHVLRPNTYQEIGKNIGELVEAKQIAYGDSFGKSCEILKTLYPNGINIDQYEELLSITRVIDKLFRIATNKDSTGESPWADIAGYALLSINRLDRRNK